MNFSPRTSLKIIFPIPIDHEEPLIFTFRSRQLISMSTTQGSVCLATSQTLLLEPTLRIPALPIPLVMLATTSQTANIMMSTNTMTMTMTVTVTVTVTVSVTVLETETETMTETMKTSI
jgi:hypothetical protein